MDEKPADQLEQPAIDQQQSDASETPPKKDPKKAAGSLNPTEKTAFYEAVVQKVSRRKRR